MKKTKVICTMGPNTDDKDVLTSLFLEGMNIARFNFSHGSHEEHLQRLKLLEEVRKETGKQVATLLDTKGPEIRTGELKDGKKVKLVAGSTYILDTKPCIGDDTKVYVHYEHLYEDALVGTRILIDDGLIELKVIDKKEEKLICEVLNGGELGEKKGVNIPGIVIKLPALTDKDKEDVEFAIEHNFDFIAASFVRNASAIRQIRNIVKAKGADIKIIAKLENQEGIENCDSIIEESDGVMVARGDLGVEIAAEKVPFIQKTIIKKCNIACRPVITATQMLDSMMRNPRPTRAEATDIANAIYDGTDAIMLSGETAVGKYPVEALKTMVRIAKETEEHLNHKSYRDRIISALNSRNISNQIGYSSVSTADELGAKAIIATTISGFTTRLLSKWRPIVSVYGLSPSIKTIRYMQILWGVTPILADTCMNAQELIHDSIEIVKENNYVKKDDLVVITAGVAVGKKTDEYLAPTSIQTNTMLVQIVE